jgi:hypothetical protein
MQKRRPELDVEALKRAAKSEGLAKYKIQMSSRINGLLKAVESGELCDEIVALEVLMSIFDARTHGVDHDDLEEMYHRIDWREHTITIPMELLRPIAFAWQKYRGAPSGTTIGECLNLEGGGQGSHRQRSKLETINQHIGYANAVVLEYLAPANGEKSSWETAMSNVAEGKGVNPSTVRTAVRKYKSAIIEGLDQLGLLK